MNKASSIMCCMKTSVILAPMSGVTDFAFRVISREHGAKLCFLEMLAANSLIRNHTATLTFLKTNKHDMPLAAQLLGSDPDIMLEAAMKLLSIIKVSFLDVNCGCPAKKVIKKGAGSHLLRDTKKLRSILRKLSSSLPIPVTAKIRTGFAKQDREEAVVIARICQDAGASTLFVHGRTQSQGYSGEIDYGCIRAIKDALDVPVYGSGNIFDPVSAKKMFDETGCDGILVARGALGNPWIFKSLEQYMKNGQIAEAPALAVRKRVLTKHLSLIEKHKDARSSSKLGMMRKIAMWYLKGLPDASWTRHRICQTKTYKELLDLLAAI